MTPQAPENTEAITFLADGAVFAFFGGGDVTMRPLF